MAKMGTGRMREGKASAAEIRWTATAARIEEMASHGLTNEQICNALRISQETLRDLRMEHPQLLAIIRTGQSKGIEAVANKLFEAAMKGNVVAAVFYLKARAGWQDNNYGKENADAELRGVLAVPNVTNVADWAAMYKRYKDAQNDQPNEAEVVNLSAVRR